MPKNYYLILELNTAASPQQIKEAYRRLAKQLHPDHPGRESGPFREVQEAYSVLSDPNQRRLYDRDSSDRPLRFLDYNGSWERSSERVATILFCKWLQIFDKAQEPISPYLSAA